MLALIVACKAPGSKMAIPPMDKFQEFKQEEKFVADTAMLYPGIGDPSMKSALSEKINKAADDFEMVAAGGSPTKALYLEVLKAGLARFKGIYLDTEDRERVALYFQELMDIVELESSDGLLNEFVYGFDPTKQ